MFKIVNEECPDYFTDHRTYFKELSIHLHYIRLGKSSVNRWVVVVKQGGSSGCEGRVESIIRTNL